MSALTESPPANLIAVPVPPELAKRLAKVAARLAADKAERDQLIRQAHSAGASLREIEKVAGITHVAVKRIVDKT